MSTESFTTNKKERMQEGVSLAQGEKKHLAGHDTGSVGGACGNEKV